MRYFFHTADGSRDEDREGTVLPNGDAARRHAVEFAGECMKAEPTILSAGKDFRVEVTGEDGLLLFTVICISVSAPAFNL